MSTTSRDGPLDELCRLERIPGWHWVVGLVGPLPVVVYKKELSGMGRPFGSCFVLRDFDGAAVHQALTDALPELFDDEVERLNLAWRRYIEATMFIHEWAHTLAAVHEVDKSGILYPELSGVERRLSPTNWAIVNIGLTFMEGRADESDRQEWGRLVRAIIREGAPADLDANAAQWMSEYATQVLGLSAPAADAGR